MKYIKLCDVCDFQGGSQPPKDEWSYELKNGYIRMLQIRDFTQKERVVPEYVKITNSTKKCEADDILIARYGASLGKILTGLSGAYNVAIMKTIPDEHVLEKKYLYYYLKSPVFQTFLLNIGNRAAQAGFNKNDLQELFIPSISKKEQAKVVNILKHAETVISVRQQQLKKLDELVKSRFIELFGDSVTNPYGWQQLTVNDVCVSVVRGPFGSALKKEFFVPPSDTTYKVYEQKHAIQKSSTIGTYYVTAEKYNELRRFECHSGDILMSCSGTMGELYQLPAGCERGIINQALCKFTLNERILPIVFLAYMRETIGNLETKGSGIQNIAAVSYVKAMPINLPPMRVQEQFAAFVEQIDKSKLAIQQSLEKLETLKKALMQQYFG